MTTAVIEVRDSIINTSSYAEYVASSDVSNVLQTSESPTFISTPAIEYVLVEQENTTLVMAGGLGPQGAPGIPEEDIMYSKRVDFITDLELYRGEAPVGSSENSAVWRIRKVSLAVDGDVAEKWASGTALFDKVWADRVSLTYT